MAQMMPYILPLLLGRTFDLDRMQVGVDIFPKDVLDRKVLIQNPVTETRYKVIDNMVEARDLLDVSGSFSLKIKAGLFEAGVAGEYLTDSYNRGNSVEMAVRATYQTVTEQLPGDVKPIEGWQSLGKALGTHYVRSITYGGEMIAAVRLECNNTKDRQKIRGALEIGGRVNLFDLGVQVEGEYMKDISNSVESAQIKVFSSIPLSRLPNDIESLKKTLDGFPDDLRLFNEGKGVPLKMELCPLNMLDSTRPDHLRNRLLEVSLEEFEQKFDDLSNTKAAISDWMKVMAKPLTEKQETQIGDLYNSVENAVREFYDVIGALDVSKGTEQLGKADEAYGMGIPGGFYRKYLLLRQEIAKDQGAWTSSRGNGVTYVHWGKRNCSEVAEQMSEGVAVGPGEFGGGANFLCLPKLPDSGTSATKQKDAAVVQGTFFKYPGHDSSQLFCSTCRLSAKGSVQVFSGKSSCPDEWDYIYNGMLMSGSHDVRSTTFVCLDKNAEYGVPVASKNPIIPNWVLLLTRKGIGLADQAKTLFPCVVCGK